jgi:glycerophosphoryl diester phosphodiesterase
LIPVRTVLLMEAQGSPADVEADPAHHTYAWFASPVGLREVARFATGIGPDKIMVLPRDAEGRSMRPSSLIADAHAAGLVVHPYTFRRENIFLPADLRSAVVPADPTQDPAAATKPGDLRTELLNAFRAGVDGLFSDFPDDAVAARTAFLKERVSPADVVNP